MDNANTAGQAKRAVRIWTVVGRKMRGAGGGHAKAEAYRYEIQAETAEMALKHARALHPKFAAEIIGSREQTETKKGVSL